MGGAGRGTLTGAIHAVHQFRMLFSEIRVMPKLNSLISVI